MTDTVSIHSSNSNNSIHPDNSVNSVASVNSVHPVASAHFDNPIRAVCVVLALVVAAVLSLGLSACSFGDPEDGADSDGTPAAELGVAKEGFAAPDVELTAIFANSVVDGRGGAIASGDAFTVSDLKGKVVIMTFWATWCGYCVNDMPVWDRFAQEYGDDLVVVAVNRGDDSGSALKYAQESGYDFVWSMENSETSAAYPSSGIPYTVIIDREGTVQFIANGSYRGDMYQIMSDIVVPLIDAQPAA